MMIVEPVGLLGESDKPSAGDAGLYVVLQSNKW